MILIIMKICDEGAISTGEGDGGVAEREETARRGKPCEYNTGVGNRWMMMMVTIKGMVIITVCVISTSEF